MITLLHRSLPIYYLLLCALLGLSLAWLVTSETEIRLSAASNTSTAMTGAADARLKLKPIDNRTIVQRNIFNSNQPTSVTASAPAVMANSTATTAQQAPTNLTLIGTLVAGDLSLAVIKIDNETTIVRLQQNIIGHGRLVGVARDQVEFEGTDGTRFFLTMDDKEATISIKSLPRTSEQQPATTIVRKIGDNRWIIPVAEAEGIRANIGTIIQQIRIDPNIVNGKTDGFIVRRIQHGTLLSQMGLMRGDILHAVNGTTLDSPEKGLQIFQQLRESKTLNLDLNRAGQSMKFQYEIK